MAKRWNAEEEKYLIDNSEKMSRVELAEHFNVTVKSVSDKLRRITKNIKSTPKTRKSKLEKEDPLDKFDKNRKAFIWDFIRVIDYRDLAKLAGVKADDLKEAVEKTGIKLPLERARRWADIDVGTFRSISACARCQVQIKHSSFYVGIKNCRKCLERNIKLWLENDIPICLMFKGNL